MKRMPYREIWHSSSKEDRSISSSSEWHDRSPGPPSPANTSAKRWSRAEEDLADPMGITVLHDPEDNPIADLVFVHSFGGGSHQSWTYADDTYTF